MQVAIVLQLLTAADALVQVKAAEDQAADRQRDLANMVTEADGFLQQERRSRKAARRCACHPCVSEFMLMSGVSSISTRAQ
jgi:hypothetical protein